MLVHPKLLRNWKQRAQSISLRGNGDIKKNAPRVGQGLCIWARMGIYREEQICELDCFRYES